MSVHSITRRRKSGGVWRGVHPPIIENFSFLSAKRSNGFLKFYAIALKKCAHTLLPWIRVWVKIFQKHNNEWEPNETHYKIHQCATTTEKNFPNHEPATASNKSLWHISDFSLGMLFLTLCVHSLLVSNCVTILCISLIYWI